MKKNNLILAVLAIFFAVSGFIALQYSVPAQSFSEKAFFCPEEHCAEQLISQINNAKTFIHAAVYSFTSEEIALAIVTAKERGVEVKIITDKVQAAGQYSRDEFLQQRGIDLRIKSISSGSMHNKFIVIDNVLVATGSFNYTQNADEKNDENLVFLVNPEIITAFENEFDEIWEQSS